MQLFCKFSILAQAIPYACDFGSTDFKSGFVELAKYEMKVCGYIVGAGLPCACDFGSTDFKSGFVEFAGTL